MKDEGIEVPAPCLGLHPIQAKKHRMERLVRPSHWSPGVRVTSTEEYDRFTDQLARELIATCTPDHLAVIAAQHMMYADELKCVLEENKIEQGAIIEATRKITIEVSMTLLKAYRTHLSKKRADAVKEGKNDVISLARSIAAEAWREDTEQKIRIGKMAKTVFEILRASQYQNLVSGSACVRRWIRLVAPDYASKSGR